MATIQNLYIDQGTTYSLSLTVSDQFGDVKNLTDYTVAAQLRKSYYSSTSTNFTAVKSAPTDGEITISLTATQTSALKAGFVRSIWRISPSAVTRSRERTWLARF